MKQDRGTPGARAPFGSAQQRRPRRLRVAGYTVVEVLMSMAVLAVGVIGVIASQKVMVVTNAHAKNLALATHIGQSWMGVLEAEAALWGADGLLTNTTWLSQGAGSAGTWLRPSYDGTRFFGPGFDALGNPVRQEDMDPNARFCVDLRVSPLSPADGTGLMRVEVRVEWLRDDATVGAVVPPTNACGLAPATLDTAAAQQLYHFVFFSGAVRQVVSS